jgi:hypothetical protein
LTTTAHCRWASVAWCAARIEKPSQARNLRAAGTATIRFGRKREDVRAVELSQEEASRFIKEVIAPIAATNKVGDWFVRNFDKIDLDHPDETAIGKPVFEVFPANPC